MFLSGIFRSRSGPTILGVALVFGSLLVLPGCWVSSINALYEEGNTANSVRDSDLIFDQSLVGSWIRTDDNCATLLTIAAKDEVCDLQSTEPGEGCSEDKSHRQSRLVKLGRYYFLDVSPTDDEVCDMCLAKHDIFLVKFDKTMFSVTPIDSDWLKKSLEAKTVTLATVAGNTDTITASSKELKAFCRRFANHTEVFKSTFTFKRK